MDTTDIKTSEEPTVAQRQLEVRLNTIINALAGRDDLLLTCLWRPMLPGEAPAWFEPKRAHITVNAHLALDGADPADVNPLTPEGRAAHPALVGLSGHEAAHAHSTDSSEEANEFRKKVHAEDPLLVRVMTLLEEPRIEYRQIERRPQDREYLRAQSHLIDLRSFEKKDGEDLDEATAGIRDRFQAATVALLVLGRVEAGVLRDYDANPVRPLLVDALGQDVLDALNEVHADAVRLADGDMEGLKECAVRWVEIVGRPENEGQQEAAAEGMGASACGGAEDGEEGEEGTSGEASGEGTGEGTPSEGSEDPSKGGKGESEGKGDGGEKNASGKPSSLTDLGKALSQMTEDIENDDSDEPTTGVIPQKHVFAAAAKAEDAKKLDNAKKVAAKVFPKDSTTVGHGFGEGGYGSPFTGTRPPTNDERRNAKNIGMALQKAQFRDRTKTKLRTNTPPGRMDGREAMLGSAQRSMGNMVTARPFTARNIRRAPEPPMTLGIAIDISGSMRWAQGVLASTAWSFAHATNYVEGRSASVLFGDKAWALTMPGQTPKNVTQFQANGGSEDFSNGFAALDGSLNLVRGSGARLLVVVSDGHLVRDGEDAAANDAIRRMNRTGGKVLWIGTRGTHFREGVIPVLIDDAHTANEIPGKIAGALTEALRGVR